MLQLKWRSEEPHSNNLLQIAVSKFRHLDILCLSEDSSFHSFNKYLRSAWHFIVFDAIVLNQAECSQESK